MLYTNVLRYSSFAEALNDTPANRALLDDLLTSPPPPYS